MKELSRKDKRRANLEAKVARIHAAFAADKDAHYKQRLTTLQTSLTTLHQGSAPRLQRTLRDLQEARDFELVKLRLYEEYRVGRAALEFQQDIARARDDHEKLVRLCKERLYAGIEAKIRKLKEDKMLMDVANAHSYSMDYSRPFYHKNTRNHAGSGSGAMSAAAAAGSPWDSNNDSATDTVAAASASGMATGNGTDRRALRRRAKGGRDSASGFTTNQEYNNSGTNDESDSRTGYSTAAGATGNNRSAPGGAATGANGSPRPDLNSESEFMQGISDYADLQLLLFGEKAEKPDSSSKKKHRNNTRLTAKSAPPLASLTQDEVTDDIALLKSLAGEPQTPFKPRQAE